MKVADTSVCRMITFHIAKLLPFITSTCLTLAYKENKLLK